MEFSYHNNSTPGTLSATVLNAGGFPVFKIAGNKILDDKVMSGHYDIDGLTAYLKKIHILKQDDTLVPVMGKKISETEKPVSPFKSHSLNQNRHDRSGEIRKPISDSEFSESESKCNEKLSLGGGMSQKWIRGLYALLRDYKPPFEVINKSKILTNWESKKKENNYYFRVQLTPEHLKSVLNDENKLFDLIEDFKEYGYNNGYNNLIFEVKPDEGGLRFTAIHYNPSQN